VSGSRIVFFDLLHSRRPCRTDDNRRIAMIRSTAPYNAANDDDIGGRSSTSRRDAAERKKVKQYLAAQYAITDMLAAADTLGAALPQVLRTLCIAVHWHVGELWIVDSSARLLRCAGSVSTREAAGPECETFTCISREMTFRLGEGFAGSIWANSKALWIDNLAVDPRFQRRDPAALAGLTAGFGVPILVDVKVLGILALFNKKRRRHDEALSRLLHATASQIGALVERERGRQTMWHLRRQRELILESIGEGIHGIDIEGNITFENRAAATKLGRSAAELLGMPAHSTMHHTRPDGTPYPIEECPIHATMLDGVVRVVEDEVFWRKDGSSFQVSYTSTPMRDEQDRIVGAVVSFRDISKRVRAEAALRAAEDKLVGIMQSIDNIVWSLTYPDMDVIYMSPATERTYGRPAQDFLDKRSLWLEAILPEDRHRVTGNLDQLFATGSFTFTYRIRRADGEVRWLEDRATTVRDTAGNIIRIDGVASDITERKRYEAQIEYLANYDALTGLANRNLFTDRMQQMVARSARTPERAAVLVVDVDRFKFFNDSYSSAHGDLLLKAVAERLREFAKQGDTLARLSRDEFVLLLTNLASGNEAAMVATMIIESFSRLIVVEERELFVTVSIGISLFPEDGHGDEMLRNADVAMHRAKDRGGGCFEFHVEEVSKRAQDRAEMASALRFALERGEFELHYQPCVDLDSGEIRSVEALIRWQRPEHGTIPPGYFIPLAEETGLIIPIGEWVLRTACVQAKAWHGIGNPNLRVAVNVSARQFSHPNLVELVQRTLIESGLEARYLELELTESALLNDNEVLTETLRQLKHIGVSLSLDDFGTGYSSLSHLRRFPIDIVKIDRSFIKDVTTNVHDASIVNAIIAMARSLDVYSIAEGVETERQAAFLKKNHCDAIQGYYLSRPQHATAITQILGDGMSFSFASLGDQIPAPTR
jgi:diguanylate cyclase (GGDEF)-like protein/PAS domain S-box-containing protein